MKDTWWNPCRKVPNRMVSIFIETLDLVERDLVQQGNKLRHLLVNRKTKISSTH